ncbi:hypothetical protein M0R45_019753 [Rubus argutus]|uniref:Uncharacterized protein n=1 Tax=Rubus argutus TaxID=59490 RepID=A0AAW1X9I2_RUBAR
MPEKGRHDERRGNPAWLEAWDVASLNPAGFSLLGATTLVNKCGGGAWTGCSLVTLRRRGGVHGSKRWRWVLGCIEE